MKFRDCIHIAFFVFLLAACGPVSQAQKSLPPIEAQAQAEAHLANVVRHARIQATTPHATPPAWLDYDKVRLGAEFQKKHGDFIQQILGTSSLSATFAARDITPILMQTERLPKDFSRRMNETGELMHAVMQPHHSLEEFLTNNLAQAYQVGLIHARVASQTQGALHWNPKERVPMNQQSFSLVLYTFAWWPVEALMATGQINMARESKQLAGWFHFWSVAGYEMGVVEELLPTDLARAKAVVTLLRKAQYAGVGEARPEGIPVLLGGQVRWLAEETAAHATSGHPTPEQVTPGIAQALAQVIRISPGLAEALGLGQDSAVQLVKDAKDTAIPLKN